ncbi:MAG: ABC transporter ATP-binding protein [Candidatus Brocadiia bacterium]
MREIVQLQDLCKYYHMGDTTVKALNHVDMTVWTGEMVAVMGPSGSGKSTMLNMLGCLDHPTKGRYLLDGEDVSGLSDNRLSDVRCRKIGFIFQSYNLVPQLSVVENIEVPMFYRGLSEAESRERAVDLGKLVGLEERLWHMPVQLSGGERQRVGIARALANDPLLLLADEPTGNLDSKTGRDILKLLQDLHQRGSTLIVVTHDEKVGGRCEKLYRMSDGFLALDESDGKGAG